MGKKIRIVWRVERRAGDFWIACNDRTWTDEHAADLHMRHLVHIGQAHEGDLLRTAPVVLHGFGRTYGVGHDGTLHPVAHTAGVPGADLDRASMQMSNRASFPVSAVRLLRNPEGVCQVGICVHDKWITVIADAGDLISHYCEAPGIARRLAAGRVPQRA